MFKVYTKANCSKCVAAKTLLENKNMSYTEIKIGVDVTLDDVFAMFPGVRTAPIITENDRLIGGYSDLQEELRNRGLFLLG